LKVPTDACVPRGISRRTATGSVEQPPRREGILIMNALSILESSNFDLQGERPVSHHGDGNSGFSLIEVVIALLIMMVVLLGVFAVINYSITYNAANKSRSQALAVLQQEVEAIRSAKFNANNVDAVLTGGVKAEKTVVAQDGLTFLVNTRVDNDPGTTGLQDETHQCLTPQGDPVDCALKEIEIVVTLAAPSPGWQAAVPSRVVMRRVRGN
jgi:Tfp pilus assembly protein PilV